MMSFVSNEIAFSFFSLSMLSSAFHAPSNFHSSDFAVLIELSTDEVAGTLPQNLLTAMAGTPS
jgi:hypothetical protein